MVNCYLPTHTTMVTWWVITMVGDRQYVMSIVTAVAVVVVVTATVVTVMAW